MCILDKPGRREPVSGSMGAAVVAAKWLAVLALLFFLTMQTAPHVLAQAAPPVSPKRAPQPFEVGLLQGGRQVFSGNLTVESGQTVDEDVYVYSGNVEIEEEGRIAGNLVVFSGNIEIAEGGLVDGDVTAYSGDVVVDGRVGGKLSSMRGRVELGEAAHVEEDVSALNGAIEQSEGAIVGGNVVQGPDFPFSGGPQNNLSNSIRNGPPSFLERVLALIVRLLSALLITALVTGVASVLFSARPDLVRRTRNTLEEERAYSLVAGLVANLTLLFLSGMLAVTLCLLPAALVPMLALLALNILGWTVASQIVGERVVKALDQQVQPVLAIAVGAVLLTGIASLLWAFGGCFRLLGFLFVLGVASFGTGAVLVPWLNRRRYGGDSGPGAGGTDAGPQTPPPSSGTPTSPGYSAPGDYVTAQEVSGQDDTQADEQARDDRSASEIAARQGPFQTGDELAETDVAQPMDYVTAQEVVDMQEEAGEDDFREIKGIGPVFANRLKEAGVRTFAQLAAMTPAQVAEIIGWPEERVLRSEVIEQAQALSAGRQ